MIVRSSKSKLQEESTTYVGVYPLNINGRPVLQPNCNRHNTSLTASSVLPPLRPLPTTATADYNACKLVHKVNNSPPASPPTKLLKSPRLILPATKRINDHQPYASASNSTTLRSSSSSKSLLKKSKKSTDHNHIQYSSSVIVESPGSIAAARREQVAILQVQRKMRIAHYGRTSKSSSRNIKLLPNSDDPSSQLPNYTYSVQQEIKRCTFITLNSDPIYVAYHDEEWGVPVHDDKLLLELLVLTGAQVGSDWTSVLKKRQGFRDAFSGFDAKIVSKFSEKKISSISADYGIELSQVRGVVDNSNRIFEIKKEFGSFDKYLWGFVDHRPIGTRHKWCHKIPAKTSKSETISKDMVRRGFRLVGPTVVHSFMQAAGLTNDHLITCPRHSQCHALQLSSPTTLSLSSAPPSN